MLEREEQYLGSGLLYPPPVEARWWSSSWEVCFPQCGEEPDWEKNSGSWALWKGKYYLTFHWAPVENEGMLISLKVFWWKRHQCFTNPSPKVSSRNYSPWLWHSGLGSNEGDGTLLSRPGVLSLDLCTAILSTELALAHTRFSPTFEKLFLWEVFFLVDFLIYLSQISKSNITRKTSE